ncbi:hypothetical protein V8E55_009580 [Tylopilus felleus]
MFVPPAWDHDPPPSAGPLSRTGSCILTSGALVHHAEQAHAKVTEELDFSKYFDFDNVSYKPFYGTDVASAAPSPVFVAPKPIKPKGSVHDTAAESNWTPRSAKLKEKALVMLNDDKPYMAAPLGRRHTAPTLLQMAPSPCPSPTPLKMALQAFMIMINMLLFFCPSFGPLSFGIFKPPYLPYDHQDKSGQRPIIIINMIGHVHRLLHDMTMEAQRLTVSLDNSEDALECARALHDKVEEGKEIISKASRLKYCMARDQELE